MQENFNTNDTQLIASKIRRSYLELARIYMPFLVILILAYYFKDRLRVSRTRDYKDVMQYWDSAYIMIFTFFFIIFFIFFLRDYKKKVTPYLKEMQGGAKNILTFNARKYFDPIYNQYLLYHPIKSNTYILLSSDEFSSISEGQELVLESGVNTGIVLAIKFNDKILSDVEEFTFSQQ